MSQDSVLYEVQEGVAVITLSRPEARNALTVDMLKAFYVASVRASESPQVRCVVVTGAGDHFCAGADVKHFAQSASGEDIDASSLLIKELTLHFHGALTTLARAPKPFLAAVDGTAAGGGFSLAIGADLTLASDRARFTYAYSNIGLAPDGGSSFALPRLVGLKRALWLAYRNPTLSAEEARSLGLVSEVSPAADFATRWRSLARELAAGPTVALGAAKRLLRQSLSREFEGQLEDERDAITACSRTRDFTEGVTAFAAKRKPFYMGK